MSLSACARTWWLCDPVSSTYRLSDSFFSQTGDDLDVSGHSDRYTKASTTLSPIPSPHHLSSSNQAHFEGFSWQCENHHFPASFGSAPKNDAPTDATCEAESENVQFDEEEEEEEAEQEFTDKHVPSSAPMSIPIPRPKDRRTLAMPSAVSVSSPVMSCGSRPLFAAVF